MGSKLFIKFNPPAFVTPPMLLDLYPGAAAAYSFRKLRSDYSGQCCRIRESVGNTETDIDFVNNYVDIATMDTFKGAGNIFLVNMYDQSGNTNDISNSTAVQQGQVTVSTSINYKNGFVAPRFNNGPHLYINGLISAYPIHNFVVAANLIGGGGGFLFAGSEDTSTNFKYFANAINPSGNAGEMSEAGGSTVDSLTVGTAVNGELVAAAFLHENISDKSINANGVIATSTVFNEDPFPIDNYAIGIVKRPSSVNGAGDFCENIVYLTDQSANESAIIANQMAYYGIL